VHARLLDYFERIGDYSPLARLVRRATGAEVILWELSERLRLREALTRLYRVSVSGAEHVPPGGCILVANHESVIDPFFLSLATRRRVRFMAKAELWRYPLVRWGMDAYGAFPIERGNGDRGAMAHAGKLLSEGEVLGMFPRGTSKPAGNRHWQRGAARLALTYGTPLVPVRLLNTRQLVPRRPIEVRIGEPIAAERQPPTIAAARDLTVRVESAVEEL